MVIFPKIWQLFGDFDYQASGHTVFATLEPLHEMLERGPQTLK
jgi:hypothetical protein